jgi:hypothetical protein
MRTFEEPFKKTHHLLLRLPIKPHVEVLAQVHTFGAIRERGMNVHAAAWQLQVSLQLCLELSGK